jgi:restriction endonuclease
VRRFVQETVSLAVTTLLSASPPPLIEVFTQPRPKADARNPVPDSHDACCTQSPGRASIVQCILYEVSCSVGVDNVRAFVSQAIYTYRDCEYFTLRGLFKRMPPDLAQCIMCIKPLRRMPLEHPLWYADVPDSGLTIVNGTYAVICDNCGWWMVRTHGEDYDRDGGWDDVSIGCLKTFSVESATIPTQILLEWLKQGKNLDFHVLDANVFERLVADVLRVEYAPCEVKHVGARGGGGDGGIDIYVIRGNEQWLVQVKRRIKATTEPISTIRSLSGVLLREGEHQGIVVTSAPQFSRNAGQETYIKTAGPYSVRLINRGALLEIVETKVPPLTDPWLPALENGAAWRATRPLSQDYLQLLLDSSPENADRLSRSMFDLTQNEAESDSGGPYDTVPTRTSSIGPPGRPNPPPLRFTLADLSEEHADNVSPLKAR